MDAKSRILSSYDFKGANPNAIVTRKSRMIEEDLIMVSHIPEVSFILLRF